MRSIIRPWLLPLVGGVALGTLIVGGAWFICGRTTGPGRVADVGPLDAFSASGTFPPILWARDDFYLVKTETGELRALYVYPANAQRENRPGCAVTWFDALPPTPWTEVFRDPCIGNTFSRDGMRLFGPSPRSLDQFRITVKSGRVLVDTRRLLCDGPGVCRRLR